MGNEVTIRIAGEAGQGIQSAGQVLCRAAHRGGRHVYANKDYMSRIRGGDNHFQIRLSDAPVSCPREQCDIVVALNSGAAQRHTQALAADGKLVLQLRIFFGVQGCRKPIQNYEVSAKCGCQFAVLLRRYASADRGSIAKTH